MNHGEKIVDGILIQYICQPCPECKAKLQAAEEMAGVIGRSLAMIPPTFLAHKILSAALSAWEGLKK